MTTSISDYYELLTQHDWQYEYACDFGVWTSGSQMRDRIVQIAGESDRHQTLYGEFRAYHTGQSLERPAKPQEQ